MRVNSLLMPVSAIRFDSSWSVFEVMQFMDGVGQPHLVIVDGDAVLGLLTSRQIRRFRGQHGLNDEALKRIPVSRLLIGQSMPNCMLEDDIEEAFTLMQEFDLDYVPVMHKSRIMGVLSRSAVESVLATEMVEAG